MVCHRFHQIYRYRKLFQTAVVPCVRVYVCERAHQRCCLCTNQLSNECVKKQNQRRDREKNKHRQCKGRQEQCVKTNEQNKRKKKVPHSRQQKPILRIKHIRKIQLQNCDVCLCTKYSCNSNESETKKLVIKRSGAIVKQKHFEFGESFERNAFGTAKRKAHRVVGSHFEKRENHKLQPINSNKTKKERNTQIRTK